MGKLQLDRPQIVQTAAQKTAVIHLITPRDTIRAVMGDAYNELMAVIARQGVSPAGPWFTHHLRKDPEVFDFEIGVPIAHDISPEGRVTNGELPPRRVARTIYHGDYEQLGDAWAEFDQWMTTNRHYPAADLYEQYLIGPETISDSESWETELVQPVTN